MRRRWAVVAPLPPARSGLATYVTAQLGVLGDDVEVVAVAADPTAVDRNALRGRTVVGSDALAGLDVDAVVYHLGNSIEAAHVARAVEHGPPGVVVCHDLSVHHLVRHLSLGNGDDAAYERAVRVAHGDAAAPLATHRRPGQPSEVDMALFDLLGPLLERHRAVIVHDRAAAGVVTRRAPGVPVHVVAHPAPAPLPPLPRRALDLPDGRFLVAMIGHAVPTKRPEVVVGALRQLVDRGVDAHLVVAGEDATQGELGLWVDELGVFDRTTITGWLDDRDLGAVAATADVVVALRSPHLCQASGPVTLAAAAGTPLVTWRTGAAADIPDAATERVAPDGDPASGVAAALERLATDPARSAATGAAARRWAQDHLDARACATRFSAIVDGAGSVRPVVEVWVLGHVMRRRAGRAVLVGDGLDDDAAALAAAGWTVERDGHPASARHRLGSAVAELVVWAPAPDARLDTADLVALARLATAGAHVAVVPTGSASVLAVAMATAGLGGGAGTPARRRGRAVWAVPVGPSAAVGAGGPAGDGRVSGSWT